MKRQNFLYKKKKEKLDLKKKERKLLELCNCCNFCTKVIYVNMWLKQKCAFYG